MDDPSENIVRCWDQADPKKGKPDYDPDYTVGVKVEKTGEIYTILDVFRICDNPGATEQARQAIKDQDGPGVEVLGDGL